MAELLEDPNDWQAGRALADCNKYMLHQEVGSDVTFLLGQKKEPVKAHKYILISRSSVFQSIFCGSISGTKEGSEVIPVTDIDTDTFKALLMYLYCDEVKVTNENVNNLLYAAKKYAVKGLVDQCLKTLEASICVKNVCEILEQVHLYDGKSLETKCINFIYENALPVLKTEGITKLCANCLEEIVRSDELVVDEVTVFDAVLRWAEKECERRGFPVTDEKMREALGIILFNIRFSLMHPVYFTNNVSIREVLNSREIIAVYQYYHGRERAANWKFNTNRRRGFALHSIIRYNLIVMEEFDCREAKQAVAFTCSSAITLHGIIVYGCLEGGVEYKVTVELIEEPNDKGFAPETAKETKGKQSGLKLFKDKGKQLDLSSNKEKSEKKLGGELGGELKKELEGAHMVGDQGKDSKAKRLNMTCMNLETERTMHTYDVMFSRSVEIKAGKYYSIHLEMDGPPTKLGIHGINEVMSEDILFHFYSLKGNKTSVERGQIPGLLFTLPGPGKKGGRSK